MNSRSGTNPVSGKPGGSLPVVPRNFSQKRMQREHAELLALVEQMDQIILNQEPPERLTVCFQEFCFHIKSHFEDEEQLMKQYAYPGLETHRVLHHRFWSFYCRPYADLEFENVARLSRSQLLQMQDWLQGHARLADGLLWTWLARHLKTENK
ncbi:MAG: hemerythrin family protein [Leptospiraceae bacterium]|nr:hemerythrin family protein [Leptospiraceae bacterium]